MSKPSLEEGIVTMKRLRSVTGGRPKSVMSANVPTAAAGSEGARSARGKKMIKFGPLPLLLLFLFLSASGKRRLRNAAYRIHML